MSNKYSTKNISIESVSMSPESIGLFEAYVHSFISSISKPEDSRFVRVPNIDELVNKNAIIYLARDALTGEILGGAYTYLCDTGDVVLAGLFTAPKSRGSSISKELVRKIRLKADHIYKGNPNLVAEVRVLENGDVNAASYKVLTSNGFAPQGMPIRYSITGDESDQHLIPSAAENCTYMSLRMIAHADNIVFLRVAQFAKNGIQITDLRF